MTFWEFIKALFAEYNCPKCGRALEGGYWTDSHTNRFYMRCEHCKDSFKVKG